MVDGVPLARAVLVEGVAGSVIPLVLKVVLVHAKIFGDELERGSLIHATGYAGVRRVELLPETSKSAVTAEGPCSSGDRRNGEQGRRGDDEWIHPGVGQVRSLLSEPRRESVMTEFTEDACLGDQIVWSQCQE